MTNNAWMLGALAIAACGGVESASEPGWTIDQVADDGAILGIWGTGPHDVWAVGGTTDRGLVLHSDGSGWTRSGVAGAILYTVYGFTESNVYAVGDGGLILHYDGTAWTRVESGTSLPLFGLWGASGDDVWIVGGNVSGPPGSAVVLRGSGTSFAPVSDLPADLAPSALFKVHGFGADDVIMVGNGGVLRWDGAGWSRDDVPTTETLFSTWGRGANDLYAVGGRYAVEVLHSDGQTWSQLADMPIGSGLRAVFTSPNAPTIAVGASSLVLEIDRDGAMTQVTLPDLGADQFLHGVWGDGQGTTYIAASNYPQATSGLILRRR